MKEQIKSALENVNGNMTVKELHGVILETINLCNQWDKTGKYAGLGFQGVNNELKEQVTPFGFKAFSVSKKEKFIDYLIELRNNLQ